MHTYPRGVDATKILTRRELAAVLADLASKAPRSRNTRMNLILIRLACCCGLRVSEIAGLRLSDLRTDLTRPHIRIRRGAAKGGHPRVVPLWWDAGTLRDLNEWKQERLGQDQDPDALVVACQQGKRLGTRLSRHTLRKRFRTACRALGLDRLRTLTIHHGRHTFISHALAGGRTLAEVRDAAGHANVSITSTYLHVAVEDQTVGNLFLFG